jgi:hypothetical protein
VYTPAAWSAACWAAAADMPAAWSSACWVEEEEDMEAGWKGRAAPLPYRGRVAMCPGPPGWGRYLDPYTPGSGGLRQFAAARRPKFKYIFYISEQAAVTHSKMSIFGSPGCQFFGLFFVG